MLPLKVFNSKIYLFYCLLMLTLNKQLPSGKLIQKFDVFPMSLFHHLINIFVIVMCYTAGYCRYFIPACFHHLHNYHLSRTSEILSQLHFLKSSVVKATCLISNKAYFLNKEVIICILDILWSWLQMTRLVKA